MAPQRNQPKEPKKLKYTEQELADRSRDVFFRRITEATEGEGFTTIHDPTRCIGEPCVFHAPSQHKMREWPKDLNTDTGLITRQCEHEVRHPDPDSIGWFERTQQFVKLSDIDEAHRAECDGCCAA